MDSAKRMAASNAIVSIVGMYAGLLAEAEHEAERNGRAVAELAEQIGREGETARAQDRDRWEVRAERLREAIEMALSYGEITGSPLRVLAAALKKKSGDVE